jgi:hypothetical protein
VRNANKYVGLSLDALQQETIWFTSNLMNLMDEEDTHMHPSASATGSSSTLTTPAGKPTKPTPTPPSQDPKRLSVENIKSLASSGKCLCGRNHKTDLCGFLMKAGYVVELDTAMSLAKWARVDSNKPRTATPPLTSAASHR